MTLPRYLDGSAPLRPAPSPRRHRRLAVVAALLALLATLALAPAPAFALAPASRLDRAPLALAPASGSVRATLPGDFAAQAAAPGRQVAGAEGVAEFRLLAVELHTATAEPVLVRVHTSDGWGDWLSLATDGDDAPDADTPEAAHAATVAAGARFSEPVWVGRADGYEVSLPADATGATAEVVRDTTTVVKRSGGSANASATDPATAADAGATTNAVVPTGGQPPINPRSAWNARPPVSPPSIAPSVRLAVVHHSVTANDYAPGDVPDMLRSIQAFHIDGRGWNDIAYNFAVDRFGTIWEARGGGITNAVMGGHAMGANYQTTGVVTLGDYSAAAPSSAMVNSVGDLIGWKLAIHGVDPAGRTSYRLAENTKYPTGTVVDVSNIIGHRDVGATGCPGDNLYPRLDDIRARARAKYQQMSALPGFWPGVAVGSNADGRLQAFAIGNDHQLRTTWQMTNGQWSGWLTMGGQLAGELTVAPNADGRLQVFGIGVDGTLRTSWQLSRNGTWSGIASMGGRWSTTAGVGVGINRDGRMEAFVLGDNDEIWNTWQRAANGSWDGYASLGGSFPSFASITTGTNQDGRLEVFAIGDGPTMTHAWQRPTGGWSPFTPIGGPVTGDLAVANDADGRLEVMGIGADGVVYDAWQLSPNGPWSGPAPLSSGLAPGGASALAIDRDGRLELFALSPSGTLLNLWQTRPNGQWAGPASLGGPWMGSPAVRAAASGQLTVVAFAAPDARSASVNVQHAAGGAFDGWKSL